jgi:hypothetical protein
MGPALLNNPQTTSNGFSTHMNTTNGGDTCDHCRRGRMVHETQQIAFHQWTDKGYVSCKATIPMLVCDHCGTKIWDDEAEDLIEQAVKDAYNKLP